jgi:hypothetical protein
LQRQSGAQTPLILHQQTLELQQAHAEQVKLQSMRPLGDLNPPDQAPVPLTPELIEEIVGDAEAVQAQQSLYQARELQETMSGDLAQAKVTASGVDSEQMVQDLFAQTKASFEQYWAEKDAEKAQREEAGAAAASGAEASSSAASGATQTPEPVTRTHDIQERRAPQEQQWETGYRRFEEEGFGSTQISANRLEEMCKVVGQWQHARRVGSADFRASDFITKANRWSVACMKFLLKGDALKTTHTRLIERLPERFLSASGDRSLAVKDLMEAYDGELREISGIWERQPGRVPTMQEQPSFYHPQFACNRSDFLAWQNKGRGYPKQQQFPGRGELVNTILKMPLPASGGSTGGFGEEHYYVRNATIVGMGELLYFFGDKFSAAELHAYWVNARKLTVKRF